MKKVIVGIVPTSSIFTTENPYQDKYSFVNGYSKKIIESGGIPVGILLNDDKLDTEILELCDAFLIQGGNKVYKYIYEIIYYALKNNKPLLGICLGAEAIDIFSVILDRININNLTEINEILDRINVNNLTEIDKINDIYKQLKEENEGTLLRKITSPNIHGDIKVNRNNIFTARHDIEILSSSILYSIYKTNKLSVVSLHSYDFKHVGKDFIVSAKAPDGVCEAIEYNNDNYFILGVHFHPELEENNLIFERLIFEGQIRTSK